MKRVRCNRNRRRLIAEFNVPFGSCPLAPEWWPLALSDDVLGSRHWRRSRFDFASVGVCTSGQSRARYRLHRIGLVEKGDEGARLGEIGRTYRMDSD